MKIYISVDMEGSAGICHTRQETDDQLRFRKAQQQQVEWVIEGIQQSECNGEITEITIADSHGYGRNISYDITDLDERISLISGSSRPQYMMTGIDSSYDMVFFVGYHAGIGDEAGNMSHTMNGRTFHNLFVNGAYQNETTFNGAYAGYHGVPLALVIGDSGLKKQLHDDGMMPGIEFVVTKETYSWMAAKFKAKGVVRRETIEAVCRVLKKDAGPFPVYRIEGPYTLQVDFNYMPMADSAARIPGARREGRSVYMDFTDFLELYDAVDLMSVISSRGYPFDR